MMMSSSSASTSANALSAPQQNQQRRQSKNHHSNESNDGSGTPPSSSSKGASGGGQSTNHHDRATTAGDVCGESLHRLAALDPPRWGWSASGGIADVLPPHEVRWVGWKIWRPVSGFRSRLLIDFAFEPFCLLISSSTCF